MLFISFQVSSVVLKLINPDLHCNKVLYEVAIFCSLDGETEAASDAALQVRSNLRSTVAGLEALEDLLAGRPAAGPAATVRHPDFMGGGGSRVARGGCHGLFGVLWLCPGVVVACGIW